MACVALFHNSQKLFVLPVITFFKTLSQTATFCFPFIPYLSFHFIFLSISQPSFALSGVFFLHLRYHSWDLLINALAVLLPCQPSNKYLDLRGTFHRHSGIACLGKSPCFRCTFLISSSNFLFSLSSSPSVCFSLSHPSPVSSLLSPLPLS